MPRGNSRFFRIIYYDRDARTFNISEVVSDDTSETDRTVELRKIGRNVNISTTTPETDGKRVPSVQELTARMLPATRMIHL